MGKVRTQARPSPETHTSTTTNAYGISGATGYALGAVVQTDTDMWKNGWRLVELRGIEPLTSAVRLQRSPI